MIQSPLSATVVAAIASRIGAIPGCSLGTAIQRWSSVTLAPDREGVELSIHGRSPSLHRINITRRVGFDPSMDSDGVADAILRQLDHTIRVQERRARAGIVAGTAFPMPLTDRNLAIGHLRADASALALRLGSDAVRKGQDRHFPDYVLLDLRLAANAIHTNAARYEGGPTIGDGGSTIRDHGAASVIEVPTDFAQADPRRPGHHTGLAISMVGNRVLVPGASLPETVANAVAGRRSGDIVQLHPLIDPRIVTHIVQGDGRLDIHLQPLNVPIGEYDAPPIDVTLARLTQLIEGQA